MHKKIIIRLTVGLSALLILALLGSNYLVQSNKTYLLDKAAQSLGRKISASRIEITLWPIGARLFDAVVFADLSPSAADVLQARTLHVELRSLPLLTGRFEPSRIVLESPVFTLARDESKHNEEMNRPRSKRRSRRDSVAATPASAPPQDRRPTVIFLPLEISNGTLRHQNRTSGSELLASQIQLRVAGANSDGSFQVELEAAVLAAKPNLKVAGRFGPVEGIDDYRDIPIDGTLQVDALDMGKVNSTIPEFKKALPRVLQFDGVYSTKDLTIKGSLSKPRLKGAITGTDASVRFE